MVATETQESSVKHGFRMPHVYVILFVLSALAALAAVATYIIPANQFERVEGPDGREVIDPDSYGPVDATPTSFLDFITFPAVLSMPARWCSSPSSSAAYSWSSGGPASSRIRWTACSGPSRTVDCC